jgi:hypothetical protein
LYIGNADRGVEDLGIEVQCTRLLGDRHRVGWIAKRDKDIRVELLHLGHDLAHAPRFDRIRSVIDKLEAVFFKTLRADFARPMPN